MWNISSDVIQMARRDIGMTQVCVTSLCIWIFFGIIGAIYARGANPQRREGDPEEICQTEVFEAICPDPDQIIYIQTALYGRMSLGRCVQKDYGHVGCHGDVIRHTDRRCSGRRMCRIRIPDADFDLSHTCPVEFKTYFLVSYKCLKITMPTEQTACSRDHFIHISSPSGYIASATASGHGYGSLVCPWKITVLPGQRLNITLIDFSTPEYNGRALSGPAGSLPYRLLDRDKHCQYPYAILVERWSAVRTVRVCGGYQRHSHVMLSRTNSVEVRIITNSATYMADENFFVLKYEAVGCPLPEAPPYGWVERDTEGAILGCNFTSMTWRWYCEGTEWIGPTHNCTSEPAPTPAMVQWGTISLPYGVSVGIIAGLILIAFVILMLVSLIFLEWRKMKKTERTEMVAAMAKLSGTPSPPTDVKESPYEKRNSSYTGEPTDASKPPDGTGGPADGDRSGSDYAYVREMWPLAPPVPNNLSGQGVFVKASGLPAADKQSGLDLGPGSFLNVDRHIYESPARVSVLDGGGGGVGGVGGVGGGGGSVVLNGPVLAYSPNDFRKHITTGSGTTSGSDNGFFENEPDYGDDDDVEISVH